MLQMNKKKKKKKKEKVMSAIVKVERK